MKETPQKLVLIIFITEIIVMGSLGILFQNKLENLKEINNLQELQGQIEILSKDTKYSINYSYNLICCNSIIDSSILSQNGCIS